MATITNKQWINILAALPEVRGREMMPLRDVRFVVVRARVFEVYAVTSFTKKGFKGYKLDTSFSQDPAEWALRAPEEPYFVNSEREQVFTDFEQAIKVFHRLNLGRIENLLEDLTRVKEADSFWLGLEKGIN